MAQPEAARRFLEAGKVAKLLHVSPKTVARWSNEKRIPYVRTLGGHRRYDPDVIEGMVRQLSITEHNGGEA